MNCTQLTVYGPTMRQLVYASFKFRKTYRTEWTIPFTIEFCSEPVTMVQGTVDLDKQLIVIHEMDILVII